MTYRIFRFRQFQKLLLTFELSVAYGICLGISDFILVQLTQIEI
jgi:hypothetical protein